MKLGDKNLRTFLELVRSGLWETKVRSLDLDAIEFAEVKRLAREQSLIGLVTAGLSHVENINLRTPKFLPFVGEVMHLELKNKEMNTFVAKLTDKLNKEGIVFVLVKGQGVAQCYERPLWRCCGDVDLVLDAENYKKAKVFLASVAQEVHDENLFDLHYSAVVDGWSVELHGSMRSMLTMKADALTDVVQEDLFINSRFRYWNNGGTNVPLPNADNDVIFVFTHILKHFFHYGIGLRQICDWCRLLYTYHSTMDMKLLGKRLHEMGLMSEWKAFGALAVDTLGMPSDEMPFYSADNCWKSKANRILSYVLETGNFGHNRDRSYIEKYPAVIRLIMSFGLHTYDSVRHFFIFPLDSLLIWLRLIREGLKDAVNGK